MFWSAAVTMADEPSVPATMVSGWQTNTLFLRFVRSLNWTLAADGAINYIELPIVVSPS